MLDPVFAALLLKTRILPPDDLASNVQILLRLVHILAGITWIGFLYYFNLVNFPVLPTLEPPLRAKVATAFMPRALWWLRWSAVVTVLAGFIFWVLILRTEPPDNPGVHLGRTLGLWFLLVVIAFGIQMALLRMSLITRSTWAFVILILLVVGGMGHVMVQVLAYPGISSRALAIADGGGIGLFLLFNVWGIVWRAQKRLLAMTREAIEKGTALPPAAAALQRQVYLVSRASFWLTIPLLFLMGAASHYPLFVGG